MAKQKTKFFKHSARFLCLSLLCGYFLNLGLKSAQIELSTTLVQTDAFTTVDLTILADTSAATPVITGYSNATSSSTMTVNVVCDYLAVLYINNVSVGTVSDESGLITPTLTLAAGVNHFTFYAIDYWGNQSSTVMVDIEKIDPSSGISTGGGNGQGIRTQEGSSTEAETGAETGADTGSETTTEATPESETSTGTGSETVTAATPEPVTSADMGSGTTSPATPEPETGTGSETTTETSATPEPETEAETSLEITATPPTDDASETAPTAVSFAGHSEAACELQTVAARHWIKFFVEFEKEVEERRVFPVLLETLFWFMIDAFQCSSEWSPPTWIFWMWALLLFPILKRNQFL
jgi:hypothetical protein